MITKEMEQALRRALYAIDDEPRPGFEWFRPLTRYIVLRAAAGLPAGFLPARLEGLWIDRPGESAIGWSPHPAVATAVPTGRYERRDDGVVAEVYEVGPVAQDARAQ